MKNKSGFTLIELLIALVLSIVIVGAVYATFNSQQKSFSLTNQKVDMQQQGRAAMNFIMRDLRMAGCLVPNEKALVITDSSTGPDQVSVLYADPAFTVGFVIKSYSLSSITVETQNGGSFALNSDYNEKSRNIILVKKDGTNSVVREMPENGLSGSGTQRTITLTDSPASSVFGDSKSDKSAVYTDQYAYIVSARTYSVSSDTLMLNENTGGGNQHLAENVDDLQIAYEDKNGNWYYDSSNPSPSSPPVISDIRAARITLVVRSSIPDPDFNGRRPAIENHAAGPPDHYRRRILTTFVKIRNLGL